MPRASTLRRVMRRPAGTVMIDSSSRIADDPARSGSRARWPRVSRTNSRARSCRLPPMTAARIVGLPRDDLPDPSLRAWVVPRVTRDQVHVHVAYALAARAPDVDAHVVAIGGELGGELTLRDAEQPHARGDFLGRELEEIGAVPKRNDQAVAGAHRIGIAGAIRERVLVH